MHRGLAICRSAPGLTVQATAHAAGITRPRWETRQPETPHAAASNSSESQRKGAFPKREGSLDVRSCETAPVKSALAPPYQTHSCRSNQQGSSGTSRLRHRCRSAYTEGDAQGRVGIGGIGVICCIVPESVQNLKPIGYGVIVIGRSVGIPCLPPHSKAD